MANVYRGFVSRVADDSVYVEIPHLASNQEWGPCDVGSDDYSVGDNVLCFSVDAVEDIVVVGILHGGMVPETPGLVQIRSFATQAERDLVITDPEIPDLHWIEDLKRWEFWNGTAFAPVFVVTGTLPAGGAASTFLKKSSANNYDTAWSDLAATDVKSGTFPVARGGTGNASMNPNAFVKTGATNTAALITRSASELKQDIGLDQVSNTSDANKPVSTAVQAQLDLINTELDNAQTNAGTAASNNQAAIDALALDVQNDLTALGTDIQAKLDKKMSNVTVEVTSSTATNLREFNVPGQVYHIVAAVVDATTDKPAQGYASAPHFLRNSLVNAAGEGFQYLEKNADAPVIWYRRVNHTVGTAGAWIRQDLAALNVPKYASGSTTITPSAPDTATSKAIVFPVGLFATPPNVVVAAQTGVSANVTCSVNEITKDGFNIYMTRTNTINTSFQWIAIGN